MTSRLVLPSLLLCSMFLLSSCSPQHPKDMREIDNLRVQAEQLLREQSLQEFKAWAFGREAARESLSVAFAALASREHIALAQRAGDDEPDSTQQHRLRLFHRFLIRQYVSAALRPYSTLVDSALSATTVTVRGRQLRCSEIPLALADEPRPQERATMYTALDPLIDSLRMRLLFRERTIRTVVQDLGFSSYSALADELLGFSVTDAAGEAEQILQASDSLYDLLLRTSSNSRGPQERTGIHAYDIPYLLRAKPFDSYFPIASKVRLLTATDRKLGLDSSAGGRLQIVDVNRPGNQQGSRCFPIQIPDDVRLCTGKSGGAEGFASFFQEAGRAEFHANTREHSLEFKSLGDPTVARTYGLLTELLLSNQSWLRIMCPMPTPVLKDYIRLQALKRLYRVRRACAQLLFEVRLRSDSPDPARLYANLMARAGGFIADPSDQKRYLVDTGLIGSSAVEVRGFLLEAQLSAWLTKQFGPNWFEYPRAGEFLMSLWAQGTRMDGEAILRAIGEPALSADALLAEIRYMRLFSTR